MTDKQEKRHLNRIRDWVIDGTALEPNLNDSGNIGGRLAGWLQESSLFNEWITPYSFSWFNMVTTLFFIVLLVKAVADIFSFIFSGR